MSNDTCPKLCFVAKNVRGASFSYWSETLQRNMHTTLGSDDEHQTWNEGPPPFPGWWNAHFNVGDPLAAPLEVWRWWDGEKWSAAYMAEVGLSKNDPLGYSRSSAWSARMYREIKWNDRWPEGARVPRMIPEGYEQFEVLRGICGGLDVPSPQLELPLEEAAEDTLLTVSMQVPAAVADAVQNGTLDPAKTLQQRLMERVVLNSSFGKFGSSLSNVYYVVETKTLQQYLEESDW